MTEKTVHADLGSSIGRIAGIIGSDHFPTHDRATLRRMTPSQPPPSLFYRFAFEYLPSGWDRNDETIDNWTTIVTGIALMSPNAHRRDRRLGIALGETNYSELRLERLLSATGSVRRTLTLRMARFLAAKRSACNWTEIAQLILTRDQDTLESIHRRIARDFYRIADAK